MSRSFGWTASVSSSIATAASNLPVECQLDREVGPRDAQAVIVPGIHDHVRGDRHVTGYADGAGTAGFVVVVRSRIVFDREVAGGAESIALRA